MCFVVHKNPHPQNKDDKDFVYNLFQVLKKSGDPFGIAKAASPNPNVFVSAI